MRAGIIHAARLSKSTRLKKLLAFLGRRPKRGATTLEIHNATGILAVNTAVSELRAVVNGGIRVDCRFVRRRPDGASIYRYRLLGMRKPR